MGGRCDPADAGGAWMPPNDPSLRLARPDRHGKWVALAGSRRAVLEAEVGVRLHQPLADFHRPVWCERACRLRIDSEQTTVRIEQDEPLVERLG